MTEVTTAAQCVHRLWRLYKMHTRDSTRWLAQTGKPHVVKGILTLLDGTKFLLEIDVKRGSSHFFLDMRYGDENSGSSAQSDVLTSVTS